MSLDHYKSAFSLFPLDGLNSKRVFSDYIKVYVSYFACNLDNESIKDFNNYLKENVAALESLDNEITLLSGEITTSFFHSTDKFDREAVDKEITSILSNIFGYMNNSTSFSDQEKFLSKLEDSSYPLTSQGLKSISFASSFLFKIKNKLLLKQELEDAVSGSVNRILIDLTSYGDERSRKILSKLMPKRIELIISKASIYSNVYVENYFGISSSDSIPDKVKKIIGYDFAVLSKSNAEISRILLSLFRDSSLLNECVKSFFGDNPPFKDNYVNLGYIINLLNREEFIPGVSEGKYNVDVKSFNEFLTKKFRMDFETFANYSMDLGKYHFVEIHNNSI